MDSISGGFDSEDNRNERNEGLAMSIRPTAATTTPTASSGSTQRRLRRAYRGGAKRMPAACMAAKSPEVGGENRGD